VVTDWMRRGVAPLVAAARWERSHLQDGIAPITHLDAEALFLLALPTVGLPGEVSGSCRLAMENVSGRRNSLAGVIVSIGAGKVASYTSQLEGHPEAWAVGSAGAWLTAIAAGTADPLEVGGDSSLAVAIVDGLHHALFISTHPRASPSPMAATHQSARAAQ
jgi:hypothetical protein